MLLCTWNLAFQLIGKHISLKIKNNEICKQMDLDIYFQRKKTFIFIIFIFLIFYHMSTFYRIVPIPFLYINILF